MGCALCVCLSHHLSVCQSVFLLSVSFFPSVSRPFGASISECVCASVFLSLPVVYQFIQLRLSVRLSFHLSLFMAYLVDE